MKSLALTSLFCLVGYSSASHAEKVFPRMIHCEVEANRLGIRTMTLHSVNSLWSTLDEKQRVTFVIDKGLPTEEIHDYVDGNNRSRFSRGTGTGVFEYVFGDDRNIKVLFDNGTAFNTDRLNRIEVEFVDSNVGIKFDRTQENRDASCQHSFLGSMEI